MGLFRTTVPSGEKQVDVTVRIPTNNGDEVSTRMILSENVFMSMLYLERRRAERGQKRFGLLMVDVSDAISDKEKILIVQKISRTLCSVIRETDIIGWYVYDNILGVIATEIGNASSTAVREKLSQKFHVAFLEALGPDKASQISLSFHFFPEEREDSEFNGSPNGALYPELSRKKPTRKVALGFKRAMDIAGSVFAMIVFLPLFAIIAFAIKVTSKGPVLFKQERLGQYGKKFRFLKFRSMRNDCDSKIHQEYVSRFIAGHVSAGQGNDSGATFKLQKDSRITRIGTILRKTSLDELPQFWNVLMGDMSLVGPRPPLEYEFQAYDIWHRRRVLEVKPGITGLWQVEGRSRTRFDDMVRLDLKYARSWSVWLDLKILAQTPVVVIQGDGAH